VRLGNRLAMDLVINAAEEFRGIGETLRRCLLNEAGGEGNTVGRGFDESVELGARELALLVGAEKKRCAVADHRMAFALTAALRRPRSPLRDLAPAFVPTEKRESVCANLEKFGERSLVWQEDNICQRHGDALAVAIALACRCDEKGEIVDGNIGQGSLQRATDLVA